MKNALRDASTRRAALAAAGVLTLPRRALSQADYPRGPVTLLVPFAPGGGTDLTARAIADRLRLELRQPVVVDNRPGASGTIGTAAGTRAPADGYTLVFTTSSNQIIAPLLMERPPYDGANDFAPVALLVRYVGIVLTNSSSPGATFQDFVAHARRGPGELNYGSSGIGSTNHLLGEMLKDRTGMNLVHVPYRGSAPAVAALAADEVQLYIDTVQNARTWLQQGRVRALATTSDRRSALMPEVPTLVELGVFPSSFDYWMGIVAPSGLPPPIVARLHDALARVMANPEVMGFAERGGGEPDLGSPEEFGRLLAEEQRRWGDLIRRNNIRAG